MDEKGRNTRKRTRFITDNTDEDTKERQKDLEQDICVTTWNVNKSLAQYDFQRDMAQCQANVVMSQETQKWQEDGTAEELGWTLLKEGKTAIAVKKKNSNLLRYCCRNTRWILVVLGSILFLSMYLPHTRRGEANLGTSRRRRRWTRTCKRSGRS